VPTHQSSALTVDEAELLLREVLPRRRVTACVPRTGGELSQIYEARFADDADPVIIKIYAEAWRWKQDKETHVYQVLQRHQVGPTPRILHTDAGRSHPHCHAYTVMTLLPGQPLSAVSAHLTESELEHVYRQMGSILAALHGIAQDAFGYLTTTVLDPQPTNTAYMTGQFARKLREFADLGGDHALRSAIERHVAERAQLFVACKRASLCHNDFHEGNVLVARDQHDGWQVTGFIDVENAIAADPLIDLAKTDSYSVRGHHAKLAGLLDGYGPRGDHFRERHALYRLYHALELWDWFASLGDTRHLPGLADDMRQLTSPRSEHRQRLRSLERGGAGAGSE
jgi:hygromycin-B 7''-O-kinase